MIHAVENQMNERGIKMNYGYINTFITSIGEDVEGEIAALKAAGAEEVANDVLSYRPELNDLIDNKLKAGDTLYVYSFKRFSSGLRDLSRLLKEIVDEKQVRVVSLKDDFDTDTEAGKGALNAYHIAAKLTYEADPNFGFYL